MRKLRDYVRSLVGLAPAPTQRKYSVPEISATTEQEGLQRMMDLSYIAEEECAWFDVHSQDGIRFVNIGKPQTLEDDPDAPAMQIGQNEIEGALSGIPKGTDVRMYHTHPTNRWVRNWPKDKKCPDTYLDMVALPSCDDFLADLRFANKLETNGYNPLPSRVVGPIGFSEYRATGIVTPPSDVDMLALEIIQRFPDLGELKHDFDIRVIIDALNREGLTTAYTRLKDRPN